MEDYRPQFWIESDTLNNGSIGTRRGAVVSKREAVPKSLARSTGTPRKAFSTKDRHPPVFEIDSSIQN